MGMALRAAGCRGVTRIGSGLAMACQMALGIGLAVGSLTPSGAAEPAPAPGVTAGVPVPGRPAIPGVGGPAVETLPGGAVRVGQIQVDAETRSLSFPATMNLAEGVLEVIIATPRGRLHEALLRTEVSPMALQALLYAINLNNGPRLKDSTARRGDLVDMDLEFTAADGRTVREPIEAWIRDTRTGKPKARSGWVFVGSTMRDGVFLAEEEGNICTNYSVGSTLFDNPDGDATDDTIHTVEKGHGGLAVGSAVKVIITPREVAAP